jgi:hypothetical protein
MGIFLAEILDPNRNLVKILSLWGNLSYREKAEGRKQLFVNAGVEAEAARPPLGGASLVGIRFQTADYF